MKYMVVFSNFNWIFCFTSIFIVVPACWLNRLNFKIFQFSILILDENLQVIGETLFPAYTYVPTAENCFMLTWSEVPELMEVRLEYTDVEGTQQEVVVEPFTMQTEVANIRPGTSLKITTWIKPNEEALEYISLEPVYEDFSA